MLILAQNHQANFHFFNSNNNGLKHEGYRCG